MPPKAKYTREAIADAAYEMVRRQGGDKLTARSLAGGLGISTAPLFTAFHSIEEIQQEVLQRAMDAYTAYLDRGLRCPLPFKGAGVEYIRFAKEEPHLFQLLFMRGESTTPMTHYMPADFPYEGTVRQAVEHTHGVDEWQAKHLYNHLAVYAHGLAVLFARGQCVFTMEDAERMLSEVFTALKKEVTHE